MIRWRTLVLTSVFALMGLPSPHGETSPPAASTAESFDCGTAALYQLLWLEGLPLPLIDVAGSLPAPRPAGFSMLELQAAARKCGLRLRGVQLGSSTRTPDRPLLIYLHRGPHGHFVVIRPVGWSGKLVQIIDPGNGSDVLDLEILAATPEWTGLALSPERADWRRVILGGLLAALASTGLFAVSHLVRRHRHNRQARG